MAGERKKIYGRGANECKMCGRKQGLVRRYHIMFCRQCFREWAQKMGFNRKLAGDLVGGNRGDGDSMRSPMRRGYPRENGCVDCPAGPTNVERPLSTSMKPTILACPSESLPTTRESVLHKSDGTSRPFSPADGKTFSLKEVQEMVGGYVEMIPLSTDRIMLINEEGKLLGLPRNDMATLVAVLVLGEGDS